MVKLRPLVWLICVSATPTCRAPKEATIVPVVEQDRVTARAPTSLESPPAVRDPTLETAQCPYIDQLDGPDVLQRGFSVHGYRARNLSLGDEGEDGPHCVVVGWPAGKTNNAGKATSTGLHIDDAWFRLIENTLARIPRQHSSLVRRVIIDNHPTQHGIAPFDRGDASDGRDGHTIWLHQHLFEAPNHWERGIRGDYFAYHVNVDGVQVDGQPAAHDLFSPVLLHEIGHLVMYHWVSTENPLAAPPCARTCSDDETCVLISEAERERPCISPYCRPFRFLASTENWAEQYRFFYQSSVTRGLLSDADERTPNCLETLTRLDQGGGPFLAPWERGLGDIATFQPSRWNSCGGKACKAW